MRTYNPEQLTMLVILRIVIGWHFLYEGISKLSNANWSAAPYLYDSKGPFASLFFWMADHAVILKTVDFLNQWGLVLIGISLILGLFTTLGKWAAVLLLTFYYLSHPSIIGVKYAVPTEGSYLIVNKILVELAAILILIVFPTSRKIGIDRIIRKIRKKQ
ncbi:MAG: DoxX family membrane protein [Bacteroidota bacterium]